mgnify:FL=1
MLNYKEFHQHLSRAVEIWDEMNKVTEVFTSEWICNISMIDNVIDLLEHIMHDTDGWIGYWFFEQDCGRYWDENTASEADGTPIILNTDRKLYAYLVENYVT